MIDDNVQQLEGIRKGLLKNSIFFCLGWIILVLGLATPSVWGYGFLKPPQILMLVGWGIIGLPKILAAFKFGFKGAFANPVSQWENVTVDSTGRVVGGDGGLESGMQSLVLKLIIAAAVYVVGGLVSIIHLIILTVRYLIVSISTKATTISKPNGFVIIFFNVVVFFTAFIIAGIVYNLDKYSTVSAPSGITATVITEDARAITDFSVSSKVEISIPAGKAVSVIGANKNYPDWTQIMFEEKKYWILSKDIHSETEYIPVVQGTATINSNDTAIFVEPVQNSPVIKRLRKGETVTLTGKVEGGSTQVTHNGDTGWIITRYLKIDKK